MSDGFELFIGTVGVSSERNDMHRPKLDMQKSISEIKTGINADKSFLQFFF